MWRAIYDSWARYSGELERDIEHKLRVQQMYMPCPTCGRSATTETSGLGQGFGGCRL